MKQLISAATLLIAPITAYADSQCNSALDKTAAYLRSQSTVISKLDNTKKPSPTEIGSQIQTSKNIISESKRIISLCNLDQEMTEGVVDLIIVNKEKLKQLTYDVNRYR